MRTTIDIPDKLFREMKSVSALQGLSLKQFITSAVQHEMRLVSGKQKKKRLAFPLVPSDKPGSVELDSERIADILDGEDSAQTDMFRHSKERDVSP